MLTLNIFNDTSNHPPDKDLYHIAGHHVAAHGRVGIRFLEVVFYKSLDGMIEIGEYKKEADDHGDGGDAQRDNILVVNEFGVEDAPGGIAHVEDVCRPIDGDENGSYAQHRKCYMVDEIEQPALGDVLHIKPLAFAVDP